MNDAIQQRARELGFDACRFTTADPPIQARDFQNWITGRNHGEMGWIERNAHKRVDPRQVLPGAKSLVMLAVSYLRETDSNPPEISGPATRGAAEPAGVIARYARYADYHDVLAGRLKLLVDFINEAGGGGTRSLWYVDTGPFLERDLAQRAGLGFAGKHTNLISRQLGNWIFLAEIITTLELQPDQPEKNRCGSCERCIQACPTAAITAPFQLDARRCISYLTIELKGAIPEEFRAAIGNRIYGCDDCLAACPWNRFAREGSMMRAHARRDLDEPALLELLAMDGPGFKKRFAGTPMFRTKRRGILRNVCIALGNIGSPAALPHLERAASDPEPLIAEHARWALDRIGIRFAREK
jgi:epoxyqueuosine reductase